MTPYKIIVDAPEYTYYHGREMWVQWERKYFNSIGEECIFYHCTRKEEPVPVIICELYLGKNQIKKLWK